MPLLDFADISLEYEVYGLGHQETILFIQGLGMQLIDWPEQLLADISAHYQVIVFDNRDSGLSSKMAESASLKAIYYQHEMSEIDPKHSTYTLYDMAQDALSLVDALHIERFHVVGFSMGGMIAQIVAAKNPHRVLSLVSLLSSGGQAEMISSFEAKDKMNESSRRVTTTQAAELASASNQIFSGPSGKLDLIMSENSIQAAISRSYCPEGVYRQGLAIRATLSREALLQQISAPTLIVHGDEDPCIDWRQAEVAHQLINQSQFWIVNGLGHDFAPWFIETLTKKLLGFWAKKSTVQR